MGMFGWLILGKKKPRRHFATGVQFLLGSS
jgi:hypothetical protein